MFDTVFAIAYAALAVLYAALAVLNALLACPDEKTATVLALVAVMYTVFTEFADATKVVDVLVTVSLICSFVRTR